MTAFKGPQFIKKNGGLGRTEPPADGTCGLIAGGVAVSGNAQLDTVYKLIQLSDAEDLGIDAAYDAANDILVHYHISEFFKYSPDGTLYIMLVTQEDGTNGVSMTEMCDTANQYVRKLVTDPTSNREIKMVGVVLNPDLSTYNATTTNGIDTDVEGAIPKAQALVEALETENIRIDAVLIEGREVTGTISSLVDMRALSARNVSVVISQDPVVAALDAAYANHASVGTALGMLSIRKVSENLGSVDIINKPIAKRADENYTLTDAATGKWETAAISSGALFTSLTQAEITALDTKGYIFVGMFEDYAGYYFNDSHTCIVASDDYYAIEQNRVWNKGVRALRTALIPKMKRTVLIDSKTGYLDVTAVSDLENIGKKALTNALMVTEEASGIDVYINPAQDISQNPLTAKVKIVSLGVLREMDYEVGFTKSI